MNRVPVPQREIVVAVRAALREDLALGDTTTNALFEKKESARAIIIAEHAMTVAGVAAAIETFRQVDHTIKVRAVVEDGTVVQASAPVLTVEGDARSLLMAERVALNFLQHLSGIATLTAKFCAAVKDYPAKILDTRKTIPGIRVLQKWAVKLGGGRNHRFSLGDGILIKDNHLALLAAQGFDVASACRVARERGRHGLRIIVEAESLDHVTQAIEGKADVILLDNMEPATVRRTVDMIKGRALVEVSGGITLGRARDMAEAGADFISIGALTHSAPAANLSMDIAPARSRRSTKR